MKKELLWLAAAAVAAGAATLLSPWAAPVGVLLVGGIALLLRKKETPAEQTQPPQHPRQAEPEASFSDLGSDRSFARWLQLFALYVQRNENSTLEKLYMQLKDDMEEQGIYIYDALQTDEDGNLCLPEEDAFVDLRTGEEWTQVTLPIVYTKDKVLMHGQIK